MAHHVRARTAHRPAADVQGPLGGAVPAGDDEPDHPGLTAFADDPFPGRGAIRRARRRLGGQVVAGTVVEEAEGVRFDVTDGRETVAVYHSGAPQQLFQEGIGVVVEGTWDGSEFYSDVMLVKHDEQYRTEDGTEYDHEDQDEDSAAP